MALTILLFKDTPFEDVHSQTEHFLSLLSICDGKHIRGTCKHTTFDVDGIVQHGYILDIEDEVIHTDDLWVIYVGLENAVDPKFRELGTEVSNMVGAPMLIGYVVAGNGVLQYSGGAKYIRDLHATHRRADIAAV
jgi:hypothetical protein